MKLKLLLVALLAALFISCGNNEEQKNEDAVDSLQAAIQEEIPEIAANAATKIYNIKSAYIKFKSNAAGIEMTREVWFDDFGGLQYEENTMMMGNTKAGGKSLVRDGYKYDWSFDQNQGSKMKFIIPATTKWENISPEDIKRYEMENLGTEVVAGKGCEKISVKKPVEAITWMWEGIPLKVQTKMGPGPITMEAIEIREDSIPAEKFAVPTNITFTENNQL